VIGSRRHRSANFGLSDRSGEARNNIMNSSKSALLSAIIGTALLVVAFGLIVAFVPKGKPAVKAQGNLPIVADAANARQMTRVKDAFS